MVTPDPVTAPLPKRARTSGARKAALKPQPEPGPAPDPEPERTLDWAQLTAPIPGTTPPVIITPAEHAAVDAYADQQRAARKGDWRLIHAWSVQAREHTRRLTEAGHPMGGYEQGGTLPPAAQAVLDSEPDMMP